MYFTRIGKVVEDCLSVKN